MGSPMILDNKKLGKPVPLRPPSFTVAQSLSPQEWCRDSQLPDHRTGGEAIGGSWLLSMSEIGGG